MKIKNPEIIRKQLRALWQASEFEDEETKVYLQASVTSMEDELAPNL